jgi:hypothetical protein
MSKPGGKTPLRPLLILALSPLSPEGGLVGAGLLIARASRSLARAPSTRRRIPYRPSFSVWGGETEETEPGADFSPVRPAAGVRSFHRLTIFRTDVSGERGDVWGLRRPLVGVRVKVSVSV